MSDQRVISLLIHGCALAMCLCFASCNRFDPSDPPPPDAATKTEGGGVSGSQIVIEHPLFGGLEQMIAGNGELYFSWSSATDNNDESDTIVYRLYLAAGPGDQDFSSPDQESAPGENSFTVDGLTNAEPVYAVVRAVDQDGNEDPNRVEWFAVPNPIVYVNKSGTNTTVDGTTPQTAYKTVTQAIGSSISDPDVNIYVAQGVYSENAFLFPGMFMYGGFDAGFSTDSHDPDSQLTQLTIVPSPFTVDVVTLVGEEDGAPIGIDGFQLDGAGSADNIIKVEDAFMRVSNCAIRNAQAHGLEILTSLDKLLFVEGFIRDCAIVENGAEGIAISALADLKIDSNLIEGNTNEGIESQWLFGVADGDSRIDITRNRIENNGDEGVDLDLAEVSELDPLASAGARMRVLIRSNVIRNNGSSGIQIDVDFEDSDGIDARCRIEDNEISANEVHGIAIDADAGASFRLARNVVTANRAWGLFIEGSASGPVFRLLNSRVLGNGSGGISLTGHGLLDIRHSVIRGNQGPGVSAAVGQALVSNSVLSDHPDSSSVTRASYCLVAADEIPTEQQGSRVVEGLPGFTVHPVEFASVSASGSGSRVPVNDVSGWQVGDVLELDDDGISREVTAVGTSEVFVDPSPGSVSVGQVVFRFAAGSEVEESEVLDAGSLGIDAGNPLEADRDGSAPDLGPVGGDTPGNVGIETGIPVESAALELVSTSPSVGLPNIVGDAFSLRFNRALPAGFEDSLSVFVNGVDTTVFTVVNGSALDFGPVTGTVAGDAIGIELVPRDDVEATLSQNSHVEFATWIAAEVDEVESNDTRLTANAVDSATVVMGDVGSGTDVDYFELELDADQILVVQLLAGQIESPLVSRLTLEDADGDLIADSVAMPPLATDPQPLEWQATSEETVRVRVESATGTGSAAHVYRLVLRSLAADPG